MKESCQRYMHGCGNAGLNIHDSHASLQIATTVQEQFFSTDNAICEL